VYGRFEQRMSRQAHHIACASAEDCGTTCGDSIDRAFARAVHRIWPIVVKKSALNVELICRAATGCETKAPII
jgi:hypothetical protein